MNRAQMMRQRSIRRIPVSGVRIPATSLPQSAAMKTQSANLLMPEGTGSGTDFAVTTGGSNVPTSQAVTLGTTTVTPIMTQGGVVQARRQALATAKNARLMAQYNAAIQSGNQALAQNKLEQIDYTGIEAGPTDASQYLARNLPTLPKVGMLDIKRERGRYRAMQKDINMLNRFNAIRDASETALATGLTSRVDYSNMKPGGAIDINGQQVDQQPPQGQQPAYPLYPGAPAPAQGYPQQPMYQQPMQQGYPAAGPGPEPYMPQMMTGSPGGPLFSSDLNNQGGGYEPYSPPWQETMPIDLPNMNQDGELVYMEPNSFQPEGNNMPQEQFAAGDFWDFEPLDSFAAFSAEPSQTNFWSGLTGIVQGATSAYNTNTTASANARASLLASQQAQAKAAAAAKANKGVSPVLLIGGGLALVAVIYLATRKSRR